MAKWHYQKIEELEFKDSKYRSGKYYEYDIDTFDYLINSNDWVHANNALEERKWILEHLDDMKESNDGEEVFIPTFEVAEAIKTHWLLEDLDHVDKYALNF